VIDAVLTQKAITKEEANSLLVGTLAAGVDTTSNTLNWFMYAMSIHPEAQEKVYQEIISVLGDSDTPVVTNEHLKKMNYLKKAMKESGRMYPVLLANGKTTTDDMNLVVNNKIRYTVPGKSIVLTQHFISSYDQKYWGNIDVNTFAPERFDNYFHPFSSLNFGAGKRVCLGMKIAHNELLLAAIAVVKKFKLEWKDTQPAQAAQFTFSKPEMPLKIAFIPRK